MEEAVDTPKIVVSLLGMLGDPQQGAPQITLHTSFDRDAGVAETNSCLDRVVAAFNRQKAKAEIEQVEKHIRLTQEQIDANRLNDQRREEGYLNECRLLREKAGILQDEAPQVMDVDRKAWEESGKVGGHKPSNAALSKVNGLKKEMSDISARLTNLALERDRALQSLQNANFSHEEDIRRDREEIERLRAVILAAET